MSRIVIIADNSLSHTWAKALRREEHEVEVVSDALGFQELFVGEPIEILIVDIDRPDRAETMLIPQARAAWPDCRIIAVVPSYAFRNSAVFAMGLWTPDQVLLKPLAPRLLCATVAFMWAQIRSDEIRRMVVNNFAGDDPKAVADRNPMPAPPVEADAAPVEDA